MQTVNHQQTKLLSIKKILGRLDISRASFNSNVKDSLNLFTIGDKKLYCTERCLEEYIQGKIQQHSDKEREPDEEWGE